MEKSYTQAILLARVFVVKFLGHLIASVLTGRKACASAWQKSHWEVVLVPNRLYPAKRLLSAGCSVECPLSSCASFMYIKSTFGDWIFLGALSKLRKASCPSVRPSARPSVRPQGTSRLPLDGFSWNLICIFRKSIEKIHNLMFFWPCIVNWLYINYQLDALIIIYL